MSPNHEVTEFTPEEIEKIDSLRKRVATNTKLSEDQSSDHYIIKWLRARNMDLDKAEDMLRKSLQWRKDNEVDTILDTWKLPEQFLKKVPFAYLGNDPVSELPVFLFLLGRHDVRSELEALGQEIVLRNNIYIMEYVHKVIFKKCSENLGRPITQFIELIDLEHYSYRQLGNAQCRDTMIKMQDIFDSNYPEVFNYMVLVNAPKIFYFIYNLLKPFVAKATIDKLTIYGPNNWREEVTHRYPMELFPSHWGGTKIGRDEYCSDDPIWMFGLEKNFFKDLEVLKVKARDKVHLEYQILEEGSNLVWKFKSDSHDICFGILHEETEVIPVTRVNSHKEMQSGELECCKVGKYTIVFDNTYSYAKGKQVHHRIEVIKPLTLDEINLD